jgi:molybdate transport system regulatory protein
MLLHKTGWNIKLRVSLDRKGVKVLGPGRVELIGHIARLGSISAAAKKMNMSYRRAWTLIRAINEAAGETLVEVTTGGRGGGGASVTASGKEAVALYLRIVQHAARAASQAARRRSRT